MFSLDTGNGYIYINIKGNRVELSIDETDTAFATAYLSVSEGRQMAYLLQAATEKCEDAHRTTERGRHR